MFPITGQNVLVDPDVGNLFKPCTNKDARDGTAITSNWLNSIQMELLNVVQKTGQEPLPFAPGDPETFNQLYRAIGVIAADALANAQPSSGSLATATPLFAETRQQETGVFYDADEQVYALSDLGVPDYAHTVALVAVMDASLIQTQGTSIDAQTLVSRVVIEDDNGVVYQSAVSRTDGTLDATEAEDRTSKRISSYIALPVRADKTVAFKLTMASAVTVQAGALGAAEADFPTKGFTQASISIFPIEWRGNPADATD